MSQRQGKAPQGLAAAWERHSLSKGRREACPTKLTGSKLTGSNEKAAALDGGALGQPVLQLDSGEALQLALAGRGWADDANHGGQRRSVVQGQRESVRVDLGGRHVVNNKR